MNGDDVRTTDSPAAGARTLGRERPLAALLDTLKEAVGHRRRLALVCGEAGIGKTHLLGEVLERARLLDFQVLPCRGHDFDAGVAHSTLADLVAATPVDAGDRDLTAATAALAAAVARGTGRDPEGLPVHALTVQWLQALCARRPTVLALDDAHLADADTLAALSMAVHRCPQLPLVLLVTARPDRLLTDDVLAATVGRLGADVDGQVVDLDPLDVTDVQALLASVLGGAPDERLTATVFERSSGNPLFVREALQSLQATGALHLHGGRWTVDRDLPLAPVSRRAALLGRVFQQDRDARELARVLSAFRRARLDDLDLLRELAGLPADRATDVFDRLVDGGVLHALPGGEYVFAHPLIGECLYEDVGPAERRRLHARMADHVAATRGPDAVQELATHVAEAAPHGDREAVAVLLRAAAQASAQAPLSAAGWLQRALELLPAGAPEAGDLLARQASAYWRGARPHAAVAAGRRALQHLPEGSSRARASSVLAVALHATGDVTGALELLREEPEVLPDSAREAQQALLLAESGSGAAAAALAPRAWRTAAALRPAAQALAYTHLGHLANHLGRTADADRAVAALVDLAAGLPVPQRGPVLESAAYVQAGAGRAAGAAALLAQAHDGDAGWPDLGGAHRHARSLVSWLSGDGDIALEDLHSAQVQLGLAGLDAPLVWSRLLEARVRVQRGELAHAAALLHPDEGPARSWLQEVVRRTVAAQLRSVGGDPEGAVTALRALREEVAGSGCFAATFAVLEALSLAHVDRGDLRAAAAAARDLLAQAGPDPLPTVVYATGWVLALGDGRPEPARAALALAQRQGARVAAALCHYALGTLGDDPATHLSAAAEAFRRAGAVRWQRLAGEPTGSAAAASGLPALTETEVRLARLVQQALTNREISDALHYSPKTIEAYLGRLYRKLGCRSRVELVLCIERGELRDVGLTPTSDRADRVAAAAR